MVIFRLLDSEGMSAPEVKLLLTASPNHDPNQLPEGFLADRQFNKRSGNLTFFLNHARNRPVALRFQAPSPARLRA